MDSELNDLIIESIREIKGKEIVKIDLRSLHDASTDYFIICSGESTTQIKAISDNIVKNVKESLAERPSHVEGKTESRWILLDFFNTVVHVFHPETRLYYELEELWSDGKITEYEDI
ncbi:MAG: ribosome silencing factor [Saprospirales bacterium]|nr:MAG: ribosome silencing factor [Saprospirales bacterium]